MLIGLGLHVDTAILSPAYFNHLVSVASWGKKYNILVIGVDRMKVAAARNRITEEAIKGNCDYLLFIDSDHIVPDNLLDLLLENKDAALISGLICKREFPYETVAFKRDFNNDLQECFISEGCKKVVEVDAAAMGCTLINMSLLKKLKPPYWFDGHFRSDINICLKFKDELGAKILIDTRAQVGHMGRIPVIYPSNATQLCADEISEMTKQGLDHEKH